MALQPRVKVGDLVRLNWHDKGVAVVIDVLSSQWLRVRPLELIRCCDVTKVSEE